MSRKVTEIIIRTQEVDANGKIELNSSEYIHKNVLNDDGSFHLDSIYLTGQSISNVLAPYYNDNPTQIGSNSPLLPTQLKKSDGNDFTSTDLITEELLQNYLVGTSKLVIFKCADCSVCEPD